MQLAHHAGHVRLDIGMAFQVGKGISTEGADIGHAPTVGGQGCHVALGFIPAFEFGLLAMQVVAQQAYPFQTLLLLIGQERDIAGINKQAALDPAPAGLLHAAPVLERLGHQAPGRNRDNGLVEILHLDGVQGDIDHITVGTHLRHLDPVADSQQVVAGQLHAGHK